MMRRFTVHLEAERSSRSWLGFLGPVSAFRDSTRGGFRHSATGETRGSGIMQPERNGRSGVLSAKKPRESHEVDEAANAYWCGFQADQREVTARGVAQVGSASYGNLQSWTADDARVYEQTMSAVRARAQSELVPLLGDWASGKVPNPLRPGDLGGGAEPFNGFAEPKPKPVPAEAGAGARYLVQVPVVALGDAAAIRLACTMAEIVRDIVLEADVLGTVVMRDDAYREPHRIFCGSVMISGGKCVRRYAHKGDHDPNRPAPVVYPSGVPDPGTPRAFR
jgi:hypothetical protein